MKRPVLDARFSVKLDSGARSFRLESSFTLEHGVLALYGPSGSGKSTVLKTLAGIVRPDSGHIRIADRTVYDSDRKVATPAHLRSIGYVPQQRSLLPFLNIWDNVVFGLDRRARRRNNAKILALLEELGLADLALAMPATLSGGEAQKVALARALAVEPGLLLLDEPFASVDHGSRKRLLARLRATLEARPVPAVFVTHDPNEVRMVADQVVLIETGRTLGQGSVSAMLVEQA